MTTAVVLMAYGSPDSLADVPEYYADIRGGRPIPPDLLADLVERYRRIGLGEEGGRSLLNEITEQTRDALAVATGFDVYTGMRHWQPRIATAVDEAIAAGHDRLVGLVLAPHWSSLSIAKYEEQLARAAAGRVETVFVREWGANPAFIALLADRIRGTRSHVVFTAHSLPARILDDRDPYRDSLLETADLVAACAEVSSFSFAFQSASPTGEPWLGPDILEELDTLASRGVRDVLVCPVGFVSDHLEIRWDIDVEARERAAELGVRLERISMPNADPAFIALLADVVRRSLAGELAAGALGDRVDRL